MIKAERPSKGKKLKMMYSSSEEESSEEETEIPHSIHMETGKRSSSSPRDPSRGHAKKVQESARLAC